MAKPVILTGLRANNDLHIGNYFGALLPLIDMATSRADRYTINLFVPDLHSFTTPIDHSRLQAQIMHNLKLFAAAGLPLDSDAIHIYRQSYIPAHSELTWILDCFTGFGEMHRMTQFKDKAQVPDDYGKQLVRKYTNHGKSIRSLFKSKANRDFDNKEFEEKLMPLLRGAVRADFDDKIRSSVGLFNYPVLMAADILLYGASFVPVGDDQSQHLEYARNIAERMNSTFGDLLVVPEPVAKQHKFFGKDQGLRIKDLVDPLKKMSKSDESSKGVIFLGDSPNDAVKKIMNATTDSLANIYLDHSRQPGISNLLEILALLESRPVQEVANEWQGKSGYGELKLSVAAAVKEFLSNFQTKLAAVDEKVLKAKLAQDELKMNEVANATLLKVQKAVGLRA